MSDRDIGEALLKLDAANLSAALDPRRQIEQVLARDRRRVRLWAATAALFWLLAVAGVVVLIGFYLLQIDPRLGAYAAGRRQPGQDAEVWVLVGRGTARLLLGCAAAVLLAAFSTMLLVFSSRRATLRQINASLVDISEQLRQLRQSSGK
jgi:hypothetical protein